MQLNHRDGLDHYLALLRENAEEIQALFDDLLISVTTSFATRRPGKRCACTSSCRSSSRRRSTSPIRVWVPGCATGEEAYTLAILFREEISRRDIARELVIFGSDVDQGALATARDGLYPAAIAADVSEARLARYFRAEGDHYRVTNEIRDCVVFAAHSVLRDPPFSKLHLISCRNLLSISTASCSSSCSRSSATGLRDDGFLLIGVSETADPELFEPLDKQTPALPRSRSRRRTRRCGCRSCPTCRTCRRSGARARRGGPRARVRGRDCTSRRSRSFAPPSVLVDEHWNIEHLSESAGRFLQPRGGPPPQTLTDLVRPELVDELRAALHRAFELREPCLSAFVPVRFNGTRAARRRARAAAAARRRP